jgi:hypothetical protein
VIGSLFTRRPKWRIMPLTLALFTLSFGPQLLPAQSTVEPMPVYGSKEVDTTHIPIPGYSGPENERAWAITGCQNLVRLRLRAPSLAKFAVTPAVLTTDTTITVIGRVEGMNLAGGYRIMRYECVDVRGEHASLPVVTLYDMSE